MNNTILQFPCGDEAALDEWKEAEQPCHDEPENDRKFVEWEARRSFCHLIGHLGFASTQGHENT
jgi:hypothetical protein